jgi:hypothetical protein
MLSIFTFRNADARLSLAGLRPVEKPAILHPA